MYLKATLASLSHKSSLLIVIWYLFLTIVDTSSDTYTDTKWAITVSQVLSLLLAHK